MQDELDRESEGMGLVVLVGAVLGIVAFVGVVILAIII